MSTPASSETAPSLDSNNPDADHQIPEFTDKKPQSKPSIFSRVIKGFQKFWLLLALVTYTTGIGSGYLIWGRGYGAEHEEAAHVSEMQALAAQVNPQNGYTIPVTYGDIGPQMLAAGAIDLEKFVQLYEEMGRPLSGEQLDILTKGSDQPVVIDSGNQHFLLNLFWAFGLSNQNQILTDGPMMREGKDQVINFASTGGWTLAAKPVNEIYASQPMVPLNEEQQNRLEEVALGVYRPCCDNPTFFPDCNHGMAMLGLLEQMASQGATVEQMFEAAKYVNAFWFPTQTLEIAIAVKAAEGLEFDEVEGREVVGVNYSSGSGFRAVHQWLEQSGKLPEAPQSGGSCGVR